MARNGSGTYTKINTFVAGQSVTAAGHNQNWDDLVTEMTNSVAADGQTTMSAPLKLSNGTVSAPALTFGSDTNHGLYRIGADNLGVTLAGSKVGDWAAAGLSITGTLTSSGLLTASAGLAVTTAGIAFPATQSASSDANTLDDYEEGTWTPALTFGGGNTGLTYTSQSGTYTKIGRAVFFHGTIVVNSNGSSTGDAVLTGLPFTIGGTISPIFQLRSLNAVIDQTFEDSFYLFSAGTTGATTAELLYSDGGNDSPLGDWHYIDGSVLFITGHYIV